MTSSPNVQSSSVLRSLVFCRQMSMLYGHCDVTLHCMPETPEHRQIRRRAAARRHDVTSVTAMSPRRGPGSSPPPPSSTALPVSPTRVLPASAISLLSLAHCYDDMGLLLVMTIICLICIFPSFTADEHLSSDDCPEDKDC